MNLVIKYITNFIINCLGQIRFLDTKILIAISNNLICHLIEN